MSKLIGRCKKNATKVYMNTSGSDTIKYHYHDFSTEYNVEAASFETNYSISVNKKLDSK